MKVLDASFATISQKWFEARKAENYGLFIQDTWTGLVTPTSAVWNLQNAKAAGLHIAVYTVVSSVYSGTFAADAAFGATPLWSEYRFVAVDVEEIEGLANPSEVQIRECIARIEELGQRPILYSRRDFISQYPDFGIPIWMAKYDGYPVLEPGDVGKQHSGSVLIEGVEVDLSVFDDGFVLEENSMVTQDDIIAIKQVLSQFADTDNAIKEVLWNLNARIGVLEGKPIDNKLIADLEARIEEAGKALAGK